MITIATVINNVIYIYNIGSFMADLKDTQRQYKN